MINKVTFFVFVVLLGLCFTSSPGLFLETLASNRDEFREIVLPLWENLLGKEIMSTMDAYIQQNYLLANSTEYMVPMSDGVELYTVVNFPRNYNGEPLP